MTACIGALTVFGPSVVLAADIRLTHGSSPVEPNHQAGKQYPPSPYNFATAIAGSITVRHEFVGRPVQIREVLAMADRPVSLNGSTWPIQLLYLRELS